jgi:hypothetical protein
MLAAAVLAAFSGAIGSVLVFVGGKDLADENVRNAVDSDPTAVGLPSDTSAADLKRLSGTMWDDVVVEWQGTMSTRAVVALVFAVALLLFALFARKGAVWARVMVTILALLSVGFPHGLILSDAPPASLEMTSRAAALLALLALVMCWLPPVGRYKKALRSR